MTNQIFGYGLRKPNCLVILRSFNVKERESSAVFAVEFIFDRGLRSKFIKEALLLFFVGEESGSKMFTGLRNRKSASLKCLGKTVLPFRRFVARVSNMGK